MTAKSKTKLAQPTAITSPALRKLIMGLSDRQLEVANSVLREVNQLKSKEMKNEKARALASFYKAARATNLGKRLSPKLVKLVINKELSVKLDFNMDSSTMFEEYPDVVSSTIQLTVPKVTTKLEDIIQDQHEDLLRAIEEDYDKAMRELIDLGKKHGVEILEGNFDDIIELLPGYLDRVLLP
jgi:hypothetical protein